MTTTTDIPEPLAEPVANDSDRLFLLIAAARSGNELAYGTLVQAIRTDPRGPDAGVIVLNGAVALLVEQMKQAEHG